MDSRSIPLHTKSNRQLPSTSKPLCDSATTTASAKFKFPSFPAKLVKKAAHKGSNLITSILNNFPKISALANLRIAALRF